MEIAITYAGYGRWNSVREVTGAVQQAYAAGTRTFVASNHWAGDPCTNKLKYLFIVWLQNGVSYGGVVPEGDEDGIVLP